MDGRQKFADPRAIKYFNISVIKIERLHKGTRSEKFQYKIDFLSNILRITVSTLF